VLDVSYVGNQSHHLLVLREANPGNPALFLQLSNPANLAPGQTPCGPFDESDVRLRHTSGPLQLLAAYTFSKSLDQSSNLGEEVNPINPSLSRALSAFDITHNFVVSYSYQLPFAHLDAGLGTVRDHAHQLRAPRDADQLRYGAAQEPAAYRIEIRAVPD
jgi:hypothetical protein